MVHDKAKSGDPDYDDKVPADQHANKVVTAGDGREVILTEATGPVDGQGQHVNLDDPKGDSEDKRPAPGEVATEASGVQTYDAKDTPTVQAGPEDTAPGAGVASSPATASTGSSTTSTTKAKSTPAK